jgi:hypothetical protein
MVRDSEGRRLPPSVTARLTFVVLFVIAYLGIAALVHLIPVIISQTTPLSGFIATYFARGSTPIYGFLLLCGLYSIPPFREIERNLLAWMHSTGHLRRDRQHLAEHLQDCAFNLTADEQRRNLQKLAELDIYVIDGDTRAISLDSVLTWRKTASLLRHVREWSANEPRVLTQDDMKVLDELEKAHARKTRLAMDIVRLLQGLREGGDSAVALSTVTDILARASHRHDVAELEAKVQAELEQPASSAPRPPVRLSSSELQEHLKKIEGYFHVEYRLLLERVSRLASKSILYAGDAAPERMDDLKGSGFRGLGTIQPISTNRILWLFLSVAFGGFLIYYVLWYPAVIERLKKVPQITSEDALHLQGRAFLIGISIFVTCIAFAAMIGALVGSNSAHVREKETPWGRYFAAGVIAAVAFFVMQSAREFILVGLNLSGAPLNQGTPLTRMAAVAPWCVLPFLTAFTICWLARQSHWHAPLGLRLGTGTTAIIERFIDGLVLGLVMLPGYLIAVGAVEVFGRLPPIFNSRFDTPIMGILSLVGFFVGALVVRDVRTAAHAQVLELDPLTQRGVQPASASTVPALRPGE